MYQKVGGPKKFVKPKDCTKGEVIVEGKYIGRSYNKYGKENFDFKPEEGPIVSINHAGHLNYMIENYVVIGDSVRVTYAGKEALESGDYKGVESHQFEVEVSEDDLKDGSRLVPTADTKTEVNAKAIKQVQESTKQAPDTGKGSPVDLSGLD